MILLACQFHFGWVALGAERRPLRITTKLYLSGGRKHAITDWGDRDETGRARQKWKVKKDIKFEAYAGLTGPLPWIIRVAWGLLKPG
jgi:hypothetical protein